jgi:hypothetical protein
LASIAYKEVVDGGGASGLPGQVRPRRRVGCSLPRVQHPDEEGGETAPRFRILTDVSGPFFTVVTEVEVESLTAWEGGFRESMNQPWMEEWFGRMQPLVESGRREFYSVVE